MKSKNIVHEYFKKTLPEFVIMVKVNPIDFSGVELLIDENGKIEKSKMQFDENIFEDLRIDDFQKASALEFNLKEMSLK